MRSSPPKAVVILGAAAALVLVDQATKFAVVHELTGLFSRAGTVGLVAQVGHFYREGEIEHLARPPKILVPRYARLRYAENTGAAFSLFDDAPPTFRRVFYVLSMVLAAAFVGVMAHRAERGARWRLVALGAILGGAASNFVDRMVHGYVIDFIDLLYAMPVYLDLATFNFADMGISCGALFLLVSIFKEGSTR